MTKTILLPQGRINCSLILLTDAYFTCYLKVPMAEMPYFHIQSMLFHFPNCYFLSCLTEIFFATFFFLIYWVIQVIPFLSSLMFSTALFFLFAFHLTFSTWSNSCLICSEWKNRNCFPSQILSIISVPWSNMAQSPLTCFYTSQWSQLQSILCTGEQSPKRQQESRWIQFF